MKTIRKIIIIVVLIIAVIGILSVILFGIMKKKTDDAISAQVNVDIDMNDVRDGTYVGESDGGMVKVKVKVTVVDHKMVDIQLLKHENGSGKPAEVIVNDMLQKNTDKVDSISGATISSKTIRNAVNLALQKGM